MSFNLIHESNWILSILAGGKPGKSSGGGGAETGSKTVGAFVHTGKQHRVQALALTGLHIAHAILCAREHL